METIDFKVKGIEYRLYPVHLKKNGGRKYSIS